MFSDHLQEQALLALDVQHFMQINQGQCPISDLDHSQALRIVPVNRSNFWILKGIVT